MKDNLETWLSEVTTQNDTILKKAREYIDECPSVDGASQLSTTALQKTSNQAKLQVLKRRDSREHLVNDKETC